MKRVLKDTALFRKRFCISQEDLSAYLGISSSALAMYESGERPLATKALIRFAALYAAYEAAENAAGQPAPLPALQQKAAEQRNEAIQKMQNLITDHRRRIGMLRHKLGQLQGTHAGAMERLHLFNEVLARLPANADQKLNRQALEAMQARAHAGLLKAHAQKLKMQLDIALLEAEVGVYEEQVSRLKEEEGVVIL